MSRREQPISFLGDSILRRLLSNVYGLHAQKIENRNGNSSRRRQKKIQLAIGGQTSDQLRKKLIKTYYNLNNEIIIMIGMNDALKKCTYNTMKSRLRMLLREIRNNRGVEKIYLLTLPQAGLKGKVAETVSAYNNFIRYLMQRNDLDVIDVGDKLEKSHMESDGIHPCQEGLKVIQKMLEDHIGEDKLNQIIKPSK